MQRQRDHMVGNILFWAAFLTLVIGRTLGSAATVAQETSEPSLRDYDPTPALKVSQTKLTEAKFPVIDIHNHFGFRLKGDQQALKKYVEAMDRNNMAYAISFDAPLGAEDEHLKFLQPFAGRIGFFVHLDFFQTENRDDPNSFAVNQPDFVRTSVEQLVVAKRKGALGLKLFKTFGLGVKDREGNLIKIDDPQFDPIWEKCGQLKLPVIMHVADPVAFFQPVDANNERWEELSRHPDWSFHGPEFPSREDLLFARNRIVSRHPETTFIGAHVANNSEDLSVVAGWLDKYPNLMVEIASRINELGRQPYTARKFFLKYQDRIMFGTDGPFPEQRLRYYWRFLETFDEYFPYSEKSPLPQGMWRIYGIGLPDDVLKKIYSENALRVIPGLRNRVPINEK